MQASRPRRLAWLDKLHTRSVLLFGAGLALQCVILLSTVPGAAQQGDPVEPPPALCFTNCPSISVESAANVFLSDVYTSTYAIDFDPISDTLRIGELLGEAEFVKVQPNQGLVYHTPFTYSWTVEDPFPPLVMTTTVQATGTGLHTQILGRSITDTLVADVKTTTLATDSPFPFTLRYRIPALAPVGVITETYVLTPGSRAITQTLVAGSIKSVDGSYRSVFGPGTNCDVFDARFDCTVLFDQGIRGGVITATLELREPGLFFRDLQVTGGGESLPVSFETRSHPVQVGIAIKPGGFPNTIRIGKPHNIPVAILSRAGFRAADLVDVDTLGFGPTGTEASPTSCAPEYSNADALLDLVCHFDGPTAGFRLGDKVGILSGRTLPSAPFASGLPFAGQDSVRIMSPAQDSDPN